MATSIPHSAETVTVNSAPARPLTAGCLFSGMGGFASGFVRAGYRVQWASDSDTSACAAFRHRLPDVRVLEKDIRHLSVLSDQLTSVDVLAAGFPCQSFSQAGGRRGFDDPRGKLFLEIPRLLAEFDPVDRPPLVVLENVPHLLLGAGGAWFDTIRRSLRHAGYWFRRDSCWAVNVKDATELPQDRERLFLVAASRRHFTYNPFRPPTGPQQSDRRRLEQIVDRTRRAESASYLPEHNRYHKMIDNAMRRGDSRQNIYQLRRSYVREKKRGLCPTLTANMGIGGHNVPFVRDAWGNRRLSVREVAQLQGFDRTESLFPDIPSPDQYRLLGNAVCVRLAQVVAQTLATILIREKTA